MNEKHTKIDFSSRKKYGETLCKQVRITSIEEE